MILQEMHHARHSTTNSQPLHSAPPPALTLTRSGLQSCSHAGPVHAKTHVNANAGGARVAKVAAAAADSASMTGKKHAAAAMTNADPRDRDTADATRAAALSRGSPKRRKSEAFSTPPSPRFITAAAGLSI